MNKKTEAKCSGTTLTVGFHGANPPLIWRFDLERNHSFTLSMQGEEGDWELGVTSPKGDFYPIAHFAAREDAEEALMKIEKILSRRKNCWSLITKSLVALAAIAVIVMVATILYGVSIEHRTNASSSTPLTAARPGLRAPDQMEEGIPLSADDVLKAPR